MIRSKSEKPEKRLEIDLTGPEGNVFYLIAVATRLARQIGLDEALIQREMMSSDYDNAVMVFEKYFGDFVILYK